MKQKLFIHSNCNPNPEKVKVIAIDFGNQSLIMATTQLNQRKPTVTTQKKNIKNEKLLYALSFPCN